MSTITDTFSRNHRHCDELFAAAEELASAAAWDDAGERFARFRQALEHHFDVEELALFPEVEKQLGTADGPTAVMRAEHQQIRHLAEDLGVAFSERNKNRALGVCETMMLLMQQHNLKEERILYPMADRAVASPEPIIESLAAA